MPEPFDQSTPLYLQLADRFRRAIVQGDWTAGERLPSVRDLALSLSVNPNTLQRAFAELEREGVVITERTNGRFVTTDRALLTRLRQQLAGDEVTVAVRHLIAMGFDANESCFLVQQAFDALSPNKGEEN